ncbi:hypothetical protein F4780DRAFT_219697 [Xylariomycetidae sp. FL0641]|nr:hypothetical protein F4780DRAFT_219697 [Xylariomycetidae sp. FL0641]
MSAPTDTSKDTNPMSPGAESPTTVKPFEMDDDDVPEETGVMGDDTTRAASSTAPSANPPAAAEEAPPAKPPRPMTEQQKNEVILKEAFPSIEISVIKAVLAASGGRIDPAFNALLGMSDPDAVKNEPAEEEVPPPQPPRPTGRAPMSQLEADELYARQLAEQYNNASAYEARTANRGPGAQHGQQTGLRPDEMYDRDHSFIDDDLPIIRDNLRKGFMDTQTKMNSWFTNLKKRIDGEYDSEEDESQPSKHRAHGHDHMTRPSGEGSRRSNDYDRYDADPQVLSDDFAGMRLGPDGRPVPAGQSGNAGVYRPPPKSVSPKPEGRKVAFKEGVEDIDDPYEASPKLPPKDSNTTPPPGKQSKWQPLSAVEPSPIAENDPFSLGDSEDEKETNQKSGNKEIKMEDSERLKQATADAMADSLVANPDKAADSTASGKKE